MRRRLAVIIPLQVDGIILRVRNDFGSAPQHNTVLFWEKYLASAPLEDVLDLVTIVYEVCKIEGEKSFHARIASREFSEDTAKIFSSENVGYRITRDGVVHLAVDREYERSAAAIIRGLDNRRYKNVLSHFNAVQQELDKTPPDFKQAIRAAFDAVEALFKLMFDGAPRLGGDQIQAYLVPWVQKLFRKDST
jgi:hypothetical protein